MVKELPVWAIFWKTDSRGIGPVIGWVDDQFVILANAPEFFTNFYCGKTFREFIGIAEAALIISGYLIWCRKESI